MCTFSDDHPRVLWQKTFDLFRTYGPEEAMRFNEKPRIPLSRVWESQYVDIAPDHGWCAAGGVLPLVQWLAFLSALAAGAANPFQSGTNAQLRTSLGQSLWTTAWVYASGLVGVLLIQMFVREQLPTAQAGHAPWWAWMGGAISITATFAGLTLAQKLGAGVFTGLSITASILVSIVLDHFGLIGFKQHAASPLRLLGGALMVGGVWLVTRF